MERLAPRHLRTTWVPSTASKAAGSRSAPVKPSQASSGHELQTLSSGLGTSAAAVARTPALVACAWACARHRGRRQPQKWREVVPLEPLRLAGAMMAGGFGSSRSRSDMTAGARARGSGCNVIFRRSTDAARLETPADGDSKPKQHKGFPFKEFLLKTEAESPLWYRLSDLYLTLLGAFCFYAEVLEPKFCERWHLTQLEDIVNVNFFLRFLLLFWANDWNFLWVATPKALLDLTGCLPVLGQVAFLVEGSRFDSVLDLLQLARFLRLLRESLPSSAEAERREATASGAGQRRSRRIVKDTRSFQTLTLFLALAGSVAVSATLLCLYESPQRKVPLIFEDAVLYMVAVFAAREPPFQVKTSGGKEVTVAATLVSVVFVPFLISESFKLLAGAETMERLMPAPRSPSGGAKMVLASSAGLPKASREEGAATQSVPDVEHAEGSLTYWSQALSRVEALEEAELLSASEGRLLRQRFLARDPEASILDQCYCHDWVDLPAILGAESKEWQTYAKRLREWLLIDRRTSSS